VLLLVFVYYIRVSQLTRARKRQEELSKLLIQNQEEERQRIALELHDSVGQKMLLIKNQLTASLRLKPKKSVTEQIQKMNTLAGETIQEIRTISRNLRPQHLDQLGLSTALETLIETVQESSTIHFQFHCDPIDGLIPFEHEINFYRIVQEGLNNILKHSRATEASLAIRRTPETLVLEIRDNGTGMTKTTATDSTGMGLPGMQERASMFGAKIFFRQAQPSGTVIQLVYTLLGQKS
jgi:two-component system, sensor histidine kinase LadS